MRHFHVFILVDLICLMLWFLFAILAAVLNAVMNVYAKNLMNESDS